MATTSITASTTSPYSDLLLQDVNYTVSSAWAAPSAFAQVSTSTAAISFPNIGYPEVGEFVVQLFNTPITGSTGSLTNYVGLQESSNGTAWNNIAVFATSLLNCVDGGGTVGTPAGTVQVLLTPSAKQYLRAVGTTVASGSVAGGLTGSFGIQILF